MISSATPSANRQIAHQKPCGIGFFSVLVGILGWIVIHTIGRTWRYEIHGYENFKKLEEQKLPIIHAFWHGRILAGMYFWRNRGIVVLTSENKDGEYIAQVIHHFGYGSSRGSTSKGAVKGTIGLIRTLKSGVHVAFAVDGPRGPRYQVQQGVTWLASSRSIRFFRFILKRNVPRNFLHGTNFKFHFHLLKSTLKLLSRCFWKRICRKKHWNRKVLNWKQH